jgi:hypothetical protein
MNWIEDIQQEYVKIVKENRNVGDQVTQAFTGLIGGISDSLISRAAILAAQGRYDEADNTLRPKVKPEKFQSLSDWMRKNIKPIPNATSSKLADHPQFNKWLFDHFVPYVKTLQ